MVKYIYSTGFASFVFNDKFEIAEKLDFKDPVKSSSLLEQGKSPEEELKLAKKHNAEPLKEPNEEILSKLRQFKESYYNAGMLIIKNKLKNSLTEDVLVIQTVNNIEETQKMGNVLSRRLREWYELYLPEFSKSIESQEKFAEIISKKPREELLKQLKLTETIGSNVSKQDLDAIMNLAKQLNTTYAFIESQKQYLEKLMQRCCPNMTAIAGAQIAAKLIAIASGLKRLMKFPSSTVQLLGAEKALFRHMRNKKYLPPKYGVIHEHPLISQAKSESKGKVARMLADKISIAAKVDYFKGEFVGDKLLKEIKRKIDNLR